MPLEPATLSRRNRLQATVALMVATSMQAADATIANVALPQIERSFGSGAELGAWIMTSYLCATAIMAPLTGSLRRRYGARHLFVGAIGLFVAASLLCSLAPSLPAMIAFRILQGVGGGVIHPLGQALLLDIHPPQRHGRMLALWGGTLMVGPILGPALGGAITDLASWRWVFAINLPLGIAALWGLRSALRGATAEGGAGADLIGVILLTVGVGVLQLLLVRAVGRSWLRSPELSGEVLIVVFAVAAIAVRARRSGLGAFRPDIFRDVNFATAGCYNFITSALLFTTIVFLPGLGEGPLGYGATVAGFLIVPRGILLMAVMLMAGHLIDWIGHRILLAAGLICTVVGLAIVSAIRPHDAAIGMILGSAIQSIGAGLLFPVLSVLAFSSLPAATRTDAAGLYSLLRQLGCASGVALMTAVLQAKTQDNAAMLSAGLAATPAVTAAATFAAYGQCFRAMAIASVAMVPGILLFRVPRSRPAAPPAVIGAEAVVSRPEPRSPSAATPEPD